MLYARGEPGAGEPGNGVPDESVPAVWQREGLIRNSLDVIWEVTHAPEPGLVQSMRTPAVQAVRTAGLIIAALMGLLILENGRAQSRAATAERTKRQLAELNEDLEGQIAVRTKELEDRSADLLTIADSVGHDLRNPLNIISINTQLLELKFASALGDDGLKTLKQTGANVHRMTEILDRLLGLSVLSNATFSREPLDMRQIVADLFEELQSTEPGGSVELVLDDLPPAEADRTLVRTLVTNLLSNALKYSRGCNARRIDIGCIVQNGVPAYFVKDNGVGFDDASAHRLFHAFERLSHDDSTDGLGLGLHIAARVVKRHDGRIWAEGSPGGGATFYFTLQPMAPNEVQA
jgi:hypothetical protein